MGFPEVKEIPAQLPRSFDKPDEPWHRYVNVDLIVKVLGYTILHPWVSWIIVLCLRAQLTPYENVEMRIAMGWAFLMSAIGIFNIISEKIAYGNFREVDLSEEVIVVTGGAHGLGALIAEVYGMRNANIAVLDTKDVNEDEVEEKGIAYYKCDVGDAKQVEEVAKVIAEDLGPPTILINNAGIVRGNTIIDTTAEEVEQTFRTNTLGHFNTLRTFLPYMLEAGHGTIVTVASILGRTGAANLSAYSASKAALLALHQSLRAEIARHPNGKEVKTILVTPGQMSTTMFKGVKTPSNFLAPVIAPTDVAKEILSLIERGESGDINLPFYTKWQVLMECLPVGIQAVIRRMSGVDRAGFGLANKRSEKSEL